MIVTMPWRSLMVAVAITVCAATPTLAQDREPSETEMQAAVAQWLQDIHAPWREMAELCTGSPVHRRALPPDICARICAPDASSCSVPGEVRNFRKGNCRSDTNGQAYCTFTAEFTAISPRVRETGLPDQGNFQMQSGNWRFVRMPPQ